MVSGSPPEEDPESMVNCWLKCQRTQPKEGKKMLRSQLMYACLCVLLEMVRRRPHLICGEGQGGLVALMVSRPLLIEWVCRYRAVTPAEINAFRMVLPMLQAVIVVDPVIARGFTDCQKVQEALPEFFALQPRYHRTWIVANERKLSNLDLLTEAVGAFTAVRDGELWSQCVGQTIKG